MKNDEDRDEDQDKDEVVFSFEPGIGCLAAQHSFALHWLGTRVLGWGIVVTIIVLIIVASYRRFDLCHDRCR